MSATALEILSEPLSLLVLLAALAVVVFAPAFHYHQFGEATRMARDAGLSSLFTCGGVMAVFGTIRTFRREIESGTLEMALSHPVSRPFFFFSKVAGASLAHLVFSAIVFLTAVTVVEGAAVGGEIAKKTGDLARLWGPCFAAGVGVVVLPLVVGAAVNRFANCRFVLSAFVLSAALSAASAAWVTVRDPGLVLRLLSAAVPVVVLTGALLAAAAAFAVRWRTPGAVAAVGAVCALLVPAVGNYYLADALSNGGTVAWAYVGKAALAAAPAWLLFALTGVCFMSGRDIA